MDGPRLAPGDSTEHVVEHTVTAEGGTYETRSIPVITNFSPAAYATERRGQCM